MEQGTNILAVLVQAASFIAAFAAITAGVVMSNVTKKFGTGILATGFKTIAIGVFVIAAAITIDAGNSYFQIQNKTVSTMLLLAKELLFVTGTYIIVIGSKKTVDKLEALTK